MTPPPQPEPGSEGARLFDAMVRWRALATTTIVIGFVAGLGNLVVTGTGGSPTGGLARGLAGVAVLCLLAAVVSVIAGSLARRRFLRWYRDERSGGTA
jgi:hypothetical protein